MGLLDKIFTSLFGTRHERELKTIQPIVLRINEEYEKLKSLSNDQLRHKTVEFRDRIRRHLADIDARIEELRIAAEQEEDIAQKDAAYKQIDELQKERDKHIEEILNELLPEAFAVVKETAYRFTHHAPVVATATELDRELAVKHPHIRIEGDKVHYANQWVAAGNTITWNMVHYDVQLIGGIVLHQGKIAEMATGEGKTLVATLPAYLNALAGEGVHIVTVNDYLARRDCEWNGPIFNFLGLRVDCIDRYQPHSPERKRAYMADITYGTNNEFGFDYLRDNMVLRPEEMVQRKHHYAMVDEVDSVLIDDARTPLIISGQVDTGDEVQFQELKPRVVKLVEAQKRVVAQYLADAKRLIKEGNTGDKEGEGGYALYAAHRGLPKNSALIKFLSEPGVKQILQSAENAFIAEQQKRMPEVDKNLYFSIDEKNNTVELTDKGIELITLSGEDPNFFVIPDMGTAIAEIENSPISPEEKLARKDALMREFSEKSERIHTVNQLLKAYTLFEKDVDYVVMDGKVKIVDENTGRILEGRRYSDGLHQAIEAKENVKVEAASQTLATITLQNYFRMYHKLCGMTGTAETEAQEFWDIYKLEVSCIPTNRPVIREDKEDLIYKTRKEKYNAIIEEIVKLTSQGRPVLVGTTSVEVSELLSRMLTMRRIKHNVLNAKQHQREAEIIADAGKPSTVTIATNMAGRGTDIKITEEVRKAGGLAIIGSERHDSRRVDRQLRGRAGRQGDPGSSQFFVSLEDDLMRLFGSDRVAKIMDRMGHKEGEVMQSRLLTRSIERAQKKVEENNFGIRKRLLEYDDVMNRQREVIYTRRRHALFGERLQVDISNSFYDLCEELITAAQQSGDPGTFRLDLIRYFGMDSAITDEELKRNNVRDLTEKLYHEVMEHYKRKQEYIRQNILQTFRHIQASRPDVMYVLIDLNDNRKVVRVIANLPETLEKDGKNLKTLIEKNVTLALIDEAWKHHLRAMDDLKHEVQLASYEQKDPLVIYKKEAFNLFSAMISNVNRDIASFLLKGQLPVVEQQTTSHHAPATDRSFARKIQESRRDVFQEENTTTNQQHITPEKRPEPVRVGPKVGRNDPCPCGSGKKYKHCHGNSEN
ncbi:MAG: preprotein translocase subunit SecA [Chitinophagales bacterium]|nr:preprotein translocase subunit SecA [Chitinophagales bacterium]MDW8419050.1 preprotein translocase subunit SecA [Chitinophagales bacterium]